MNDKKILFFDIDGTLLTPHPLQGSGEHQPRPHKSP